MSVEMIECEEHGKQKAAEVCVHLVQTRDDGVPRGFVADRNDGAVSAYCDKCDAMVEAKGGWDEATEAAADFHQMCEVCTAEVAAKNDVEMP